MTSPFAAIASHLPSVPYGPQSNALKGYWLPQTSTINWCEEDYYATIYSAEIINTTTNFLFVLLAIRGVLNCIRNKHDRIFIVTFIGYGCVGMGSLAFHATLKYPWQLVDELSMIYTTSFSCYASYSYKRGPLYTFCVGAFLLGLDIFITLYYHYIKDPLFHQRAYALLTAAVLLRSMYLMESRLRPSLNQRKREREIAAQKGPLTAAQKAEYARKDKRDSEILGTMWTMVAYGLGIFLGGFAIWQLDNVYCSTLRVWRRELGLPWGILLEGHGWWHIMTGIGAYFYIMWGIWLRQCLSGRQDEYDLYWPNLVFSLPLVVKREGSPDSHLVDDEPVIKPASLPNGTHKSVANGKAPNGNTPNGRVPNGKKKAL